MRNMRIKLWVECAAHKKRFCVEAAPGWRHPIITAKLVVFLAGHVKWLCRVKERYMATVDVWLLEENGRFEIDEVAE
jgi:hypothetical protein